MRPFLLLLFSALSLFSSEADLLRLADEDSAVRKATIETLAASGDQRLVGFFDEYAKNSGFTWQGRVVLALEPDGDLTPLHPLTREKLSTALPRSALTELPLTRKDKLAASAGVSRLRLADPDPAQRLTAVSRTGDAGRDANRALLAPIAANDPDSRIRRSAAEGVALIDLASAESAVRIAGAKMLEELASSRAGDVLKSIRDKDADPAVRQAASAALAAIDRHHTTVRTIQTVFSGVSLGSVLIVMALGLAITFGLMGVINMAHGEMLMVGAYAALLVQWLFVWALPPSLLPFYFPLGLVAGFISAGAVGWLLELTVIRHLYGRPLETLLATIGIGQVMIWSVRYVFGDNQAVVAPAWLTGGWEPMPDLVLPWNRLFIILVTVISVAAVWVLMNRTRLGLLLRATVQSRRTAASLGVDTRTIDGLTFALGSGLAGAAGCALTLINGLKPDMGQEFIIDSFLVVAAGGVGNLWGVVCAGLGLGIATKFLEPWTQAVFAKVLVLAAVILFLQVRPQGLFPPRGRLADV